MATFLRYNIPHFGEAVLTSIYCEHCGYKSSDVIIAKEENPKEYRLVVDTPEKLNYKVIRSSYGSIKIPEAGLEIKATGFSEGYITNVEGVILRVIDDLNEKIKTPENEEKIKEIISKLELFRSGKEKFTIEIEDPTGNSAIIKELD